MSRSEVQVLHRPPRKTALRSPHPLSEQRQRDGVRISLAPAQDIGDLLPLGVVDEIEELIAVRRRKNEGEDPHGHRRQRLHDGLRNEHPAMRRQISGSAFAEILPYDRLPFRASNGRVFDG